MIFSRLGKTIALFLGKVRAMQLIINGEPRDVGDAKSIRDVVRALGLTDGPVAVEVNREIVPRAEHDTFVVHEGDVLEVVHFVGGG